MLLKHVALVCGSEENSDRFYGKLLGLTKMDSKILSRELARQIFEVNSELKIINYADDSIHFEIFIDPRKSSENRSIEHVCVEIDDMALFLEKCHAMGINVLKIPKGDKLLVFVTDYDGNLFEIKSKI